MYARRFDARRAAAFQVDVPCGRTSVRSWQRLGRFTGLEVTILRLLKGEEARAPGSGPVTYLAEVDDAPAAPLTPWPGDPIAEEPLRCVTRVPAARTTTFAGPMASRPTGERGAPVPPSSAHLEPLQPLAPCAGSIGCSRFLDAIEPDERVYHAADPALWLGRAARLAPES